jgi:hypothetical protein
MKTIIAAASALALALSAGSALAGGKAKGPTVAAPKQPIPYSQLDNYLKASPKQRTHKDWWNQADAATGAAADTSATARTMPNDTPSKDPSMPSGAVNPKPDDAATGAPPPPMDATTPRADNPDQGKGEMANPAVDKPH